MPLGAGHCSIMSCAFPVTPSEGIAAASLYDRWSGLLPLALGRGHLDAKEWTHTKHKKTKKKEETRSHWRLVCGDEVAFDDHALLRR